MATTIGNLAIIMSANTAKFNAGMKASSKHVTAFTGVVSQASSRMKMFGGLLLGGGIVTMSHRAVEMADSLEKVSSKLGIAVDELSRFHHAANLSGVASNTFDMALQRMTRRVAEAAQGTGEARGALAELGLDAGALSTGGPGAALLAIGDALSKAGSQADKVRLAFKLFDSEGVSMVNVIGQGREQLLKLADAADKSGATMRSRTVKALVNLKDNWTDLAARMTVGAANILAATKPVLDKVIAGVGTLAAWVGRLTAQAGSGTTMLLKFAAGALVIAPALKAVVVVGRAVVATYRAMASASAIAQAFAGPAGWAALALGAATAAAAVVAVGSAFDDLNVNMQTTQANAMATAGAIDGLAEAQDHLNEVNAVAKREAEIAKDADRERTQIINGLWREYTELGKTEREILEQDLRLARASEYRIEQMLGVYDAIQKQKDAIEQQKKAQEELNSVRERAASIIDSNMNAEQRAAEQMAEVLKLQERGILSKSEAAKALSRLSAPTSGTADGTVSAAFEGTAAAANAEREAERGQRRLLDESQKHTQLLRELAGRMGMTVDALRDILRELPGTVGFV